MAPADVEAALPESTAPSLERKRQEEVERDRERRRGVERERRG